MVHSKVPQRLPRQDSAARRHRIAQLSGALPRKPQKPPHTSPSPRFVSEHSLRGPRVTNLDANIFRDSKATDHFTIQLPAEALTCSNTPHFSNPSANVPNLQLNPDGIIPA